MSRPESKNELSPQGKQRKEAMLEKLQQELVCVHSKRRQRTAGFKGAALLAVAVIAGIAWSFTRPPHEPENRVANSTPNSTAIPDRAPLVVSVGNVAGIVDKYVVSNADDSAEFEAMADDELLKALADAGQPSVLGKIDGKVRVIGKALPAAKRGKPL